MKTFIRFFRGTRNYLDYLIHQKDSRDVTAIFKNMQTLKFKSHLYKMKAFFATINHSRIKIQSESMNPETEKHIKMDLGPPITNH